MATRIVRIEVCDICGAEEELEKFRISARGGESRGVTLCQDKKHGAQVIKGIVELAVKKTPTGRTRPGKVATMNEVAAARTKRARKRA